LDSRFIGLRAPIEKLDEPLWYNERTFGFDNILSNISNLNFRKNNLEKNSNFFLTVMKKK
jgi:hypothetical protein